MVWDVNTYAKVGSRFNFAEISAKIYTLEVATIETDFRGARKLRIHIYTSHLKLDCD